MHQVKKLLEKMFKGIGSPLAHEAHLLLSRGEWAKLQQLRISPSSYEDPQSYFQDALVVEAARKLLLPGDRAARKTKAVETFLQCERECALTNARMLHYKKLRLGTRLISDVFELKMLDFIDQWRRSIRLVLGPVPGWLEPGFSSGSTLSNKGSLTTIPDKIRTEQPTYYPGLFPYEWLLEGTPMLRSAHKAVRGNRFFTVPKDSEKDRGCCVEASLAVSFQLAVGKVLKQRYRKRYKVDLATESEAIHHRLAREGSLFGNWATIDLSNASDTVSKGLIDLLLPDDWFMLLNSLRAPVTHVPDERKTYFLQKFSSMGNGFTFELETIIFRSLVETLGSEGYVFGDDIIVPSDKAEMVVNALTFFGFTPNRKKTFLKGAFRESCGGDFMSGRLVRAYYLKEIPDDPQKWIAVANGLRKADPHLRYFKAAWWYAIDQIPTKYRVFGPEWLENSVIFCPDARPTERRHTQKSGNKRIVDYICDSWKIVVKKQESFYLGEHWDYVTATAAACLGTQSQVVPRDSRVLGFYVTWVPDRCDLRGF